MIVNKNFISGQVLNASDLNTIVSGLNSIEYKLPNVSTTDIIEEQKKLLTIIDDVKKKVTNLTLYVHENDVAVIKHSLSLLEDAVSKYRADLDYAKLKIDGHESTFESLKNEFNKKLDDANELLNQNQEKIQETITKLEDAKDALDEAKKTLDDLAGSGEAGTTIESALARIREFAEWYDENKEYINSYQLIVDMIDGYKEEILQHIDTSNETITGIHNRLDAAEGSIEEVVEKINTQDGTVTTLGDRISVNEGLISLYGEYIDINDSSIKKVSADLNTLTAKYNITASNVATNTNNISQALVDIDGINSTIEQHASSIKTNESSISDVSTKLDAVNATITTEVSTAVGDKFTSITETIDGFSAEIDRVSSYIDEEFESVVEQKVNAQLGEIKTQIETANALSGKVTQIETGLLAADAKITSAVTLVETANGEVTSVRSDLKGLTGEFDVLSSKVDANDAKVAEFKVGYDKINSIVTEDGKVSNTAIDVNGIVNSVVNHDDIKTMSSNITQNANNISMIVNSGTQTGDTWTPNVDPATIIASITEDDDKTLKSSIVLSADTIALTGKTVVDNLNAMDITVGGGSTKFNQNGSGYTANGNISWDETGNVNGVTIHNTEGIYVYMPVFQKVYDFMYAGWMLNEVYVSHIDKTENSKGCVITAKCALLEWDTLYVRQLQDDLRTKVYGYDFTFYENSRFYKGGSIDGDCVFVLYNGVIGSDEYTFVHFNNESGFNVCNIATKPDMSTETWMNAESFFVKHNDTYYFIVYYNNYSNNYFYFDIFKSSDLNNWTHTRLILNENLTYEVNPTVGLLNNDTVAIIYSNIEENKIQMYTLDFTKSTLSWNNHIIADLYHFLDNCRFNFINGSTVTVSNKYEYEKPAILIVHVKPENASHNYLIEYKNNTYTITEEFGKDNYELKNLQIITNASSECFDYKTCGDYTYINTTPKFIYCRKNGKMHLSDQDVLIDHFMAGNDAMYGYVIGEDEERPSIYSNKDTKVNLVDLIFSKLM